MKELVGDKLVSFGLYRDDILVVSDMPGSMIERTKKLIFKIFQEKGLRLTCDSDIYQRTNFLDITFDLGDKTYRPYKKPNDIICYVSSQSNHPPNILKMLPSMINNRIEKLCSTEEIFDLNKQPYVNALTTAGYEDFQFSFGSKNEPQN